MSVAEYGYDNDAVEDGEQPMLYQLADDDQQYAAFDLEKMLHTFPQEELSIILLRHLGYKPKEIVRIMGLTSIGTYYAMRTQLKKSYQIKRYLVETYNEAHGR